MPATRSAFASRVSATAATNSAGAHGRRRVGITAAIIAAAASISASVWSPEHISATSTRTLGRSI